MFYSTDPMTAITIVNYDSTTFIVQATGSNVETKIVEKISSKFCSFGLKSRHPHVLVVNIYWCHKATVPTG